MNLIAKFDNKLFNVPIGQPDIFSSSVESV